MFLFQGGRECLIHMESPRPTCHRCFMSMLMVLAAIDWMVLLFIRTTLNAFHLPWDSTLQFTNHFHRGQVFYLHYDHPVTYEKVETWWWEFAQVAKLGCKLIWLCLLSSVLISPDIPGCRELHPNHYSLSTLLCQGPERVLDQPLPHAQWFCSYYVLCNFVYMI